MDNVCRWCRHFKDGCCVNGDAFDYEIDLSGFSESGDLSDAIKEGFRDIEVFDETQIGLIEDIGSSVSAALYRFVKQGFTEGVYIRNPEDFGCNLFR